MENLNNINTTTQPIKPTIRVVGYARVSTKRQGDDDKISLPDQEAWFKEICKDRGWEYVETYVDKLLGDIEFDNRPDGIRLLNDAKLKIFDLVLIYHSSRLAREPWIGMKTISILGKMRIQVHIRNAPIEPVPPDKFIYGTNVAAEYMAALCLVGDKQENIARSERVTMGHKNLAKRGIFQFNLYGLKKIQEFITTSDGKTKYIWHYEKEPKEARVVNDIFIMFVYNNKSLRRICKDLIQKNIPSPAGLKGLGSWSPITIRNILSNPKYIQKNRWGRKLGSKYREGRNDNGIQRRTFAPQDKWILSDGVNFPIIIEDEQVFYKAQERLKQRGKANVSGRQLASKCPFAGLVWCGLCNLKSNLKFKLAKQKGREYPRWDFIDQSYVRGLDCRRHLISATKLEAYVLEKLQSRLEELKSETIEKELIKQTQNTKQSIQSTLSGIENELKQTRTIKMNLLDFISRKVISEKDYAEKNTEVEAKIQSLEEEQVRIRNLINNTAEQVNVLRTQKEILTLLSSTTDPEARKAIIRSILDKVVIYPNEIKIFYQFTHV